MAKKISTGVEITGTAKDFKAAAADAKKAMQELKAQAEQYSKSATSQFKQIRTTLAQIGIAAAAFKILSDWVKSTDQGAEMMNITLNVSRQIITDLIMQQRLHLAESIKLAKAESRSREADRIDLVKNSIFQRDYNKYRYEAADATLDHEQKLVALNKAMDTYNEMMQYNIADAKEDLRIVEERLKLDPTNTKLLNEQARLVAHIINLQGQRYTETRRVHAEITRLEKERVEQAEKTAQGVEEAKRREVEAIRRAAEEEMRALEAMKREYEDFFRVKNLWITKETSFAEMLKPKEGFSLTGAAGINKLAGGPQAEIKALSDGLYEQISIVQDLESTFQSMFINVGGGFKGMVDVFLDSLKMLIAQLAAKAAILALLNVIAPGSGMAVSAFTSLSQSLGGLGFKKFAAGGIVSGPTAGVLGEYSGARHNPEVVAPLRDLKGMLGGLIKVEFGDARLKGNDIYFSVIRTSEMLNNVS